MILATPIFYPVIVKLGFDPIWFGIMMASHNDRRHHTPVAISVFVVKNITGDPSA